MIIKIFLIIKNNISDVPDCLYITLGVLENINMSGCSNSILSQTLGAGIGGVVVGLFIGAVISCVTTKIVWGAPNMKKCQKSSEQSKLRFVENQLMTIHVNTCTGEFSN